MTTLLEHRAINRWDDCRKTAEALADSIAFHLQQACDYNGGDDDGQLFEQFLQLQDCLERLFTLQKEINESFPADQKPKSTTLFGLLRLMSRLQAVCDLAMAPGVGWMDIDHQFWQLCREMELHFKEAAAVSARCTLAERLL